MPEETPKAAENKLNEFLVKLMLPLLASLIVGYGTGYLGAEKAIAELKVRVDRMELVQDRLVDQQRQDGQTMVRIETKLDMLMSKVVDLKEQRDDR